MKEKNPQGRRTPNLLVLDISRLGISWVRPETVWAPVLQSLTIDWSEQPFLGVVVVFAGLGTTNLYGGSQLRPDLSEDDIQSANRVLFALGIGGMSDDTGPAGVPDSQ